MSGSRQGVGERIWEAVRSVSFLRRVSREWKHGRPAEWIDRVLAPFVDPVETIVIAGVWRSGTTWLQATVAEMVEAKTVFEPLTPQFAGVLPLYRQAAASGTPIRDAYYLPYRFDGPLRDWMKDALRGAVPGSGVRRLRRGFGHALRRRVVVKMCRGHFVLPAVHELFRPRVIHVVRDLRSVVASMKRAGWIRWVSEPCLERHLLRVPDGRAEYFGKWAPLIHEMDSEGAITRAATFLAMMIRYLLDKLEGKPKTTIVSYEDVVVEGGRTLMRALGRLGAEDVRSANGAIDRDSPTTRASDRSLEQRLSGWKQDLSAGEADSVLRAVHEVGVEAHSVWTP